MPRQRLPFAQEAVELDLPDGTAWVRRHPPAAVPDVHAAAQASLQRPLDFPPLAQCLTPDDHITVAVREEVNGLVPVLTAVLEELAKADVRLEATTVLCPPRLYGETPDWQAQLPEAFREVEVAVHDPGDQKQLAYLASTKAGRRVYLNRLLHDADQVIVMGRAGIDPVMEYTGGLGDLFPAFSDEPTRTEFLHKPIEVLPGKKPWPVRHEVEEVGWLLGMPFIIQILEGAGDDVAALQAGGANAVAEQMRDKLHTLNRHAVLNTADLVIATLSGDPRRHTFAEVCHAFANASRVVVPGGRVVLLTRSQGELGPGVAYYRQAENPIQGLSLVRKHHTPDMVSFWQLTLAVARAKLYLLSGWPADAQEEMSLVPLDHPGQVQKLIDDAQQVAVLPDANRVMAVVER
jgi:nickel-dependent lactate racemase